MNAFTELGFQNLDTVAAYALKRGRNGMGYEVGVWFWTFTGPTEATLTPDQVQDIRSTFESTTDAELAVYSVAGIVQTARTGAMPTITGVTHEESF